MALVFYDVQKRKAPYYRIEFRVPGRGVVGYHNIAVTSWNQTRLSFGKGAIHSSYELRVSYLGKTGKNAQSIHRLPIPALPAREKYFAMPSHYRDTFVEIVNA